MDIQKGAVENAERLKRQLVLFGCCKRNFTRKKLQGNLYVFGHYNEVLSDSGKTKAWNSPGRLSTQERFIS
jgi:hypothetical protein